MGAESERAKPVKGVFILKKTKKKKQGRGEGGRISSRRNVFCFDQNISQKILSSSLFFEIEAPMFSGDQEADGGWAVRTHSLAFSFAAGIFCHNSPALLFYAAIETLAVCSLVIQTTVNRRVVRGASRVGTTEQTCCTLEKNLPSRNLWHFITILGEAFLSAGIMKGSSMWHFRAAVLTLWIISSILLFITVQIHINSNSNDSNTAATLPGEASSTQCRKVAAEHQLWHNPGQGTWPNRRLHLWRQTQIQRVISLIFLKRKGMTFVDADELVHGWQVYGVIFNAKVESRWKN